LSPSYEKPVCLFCSYDKDSSVKESVYYYLNALRLAGFDIIFISTSEMIEDADLEKLSGYCIRIMCRENKGYDFYGWKTALEKYPQYKLHSGLLLANDSVLGPLFDFNDIVDRLENCDADIIGMTNSFQFHPHLQSYFLYCKKKVILSEEFARFFQNVEVLELKIAIIRRYEVGFSRLLGRHFRIMALYDLKQLVARVGYYEKPVKWVNPFLLWKPLITEFKFPFLKKSLLTSKKVRDQDEIPIILARYTTYNLDIYESCGQPWGVKT
jgi:lipopolysaccharide biosynthesis protein